MITDHQRFEFMMALGKSARDEHGLQLSDWENRFLTSFRQSSRPTLWFTPGRSAATDNLWRKYAVELNHPFPLALTPDARPQMPSASADGCEYFVKLDGRQQRCNEPAVYVNKSGFRYCGLHGDHVQRDLRRRGGHMELRPFTPPNIQQEKTERTENQSSVTSVTSCSKSP